MTDYPWIKDDWNDDVVPADAFEAFDRRMCWTYEEPYYWAAGVADSFTRVVEFIYDSYRAGEPWAQDAYALLSKEFPFGSE